MKKFLLAIGFIFYVVVASFSLDLHVCTKNVEVLKAPTVIDYVNAKLAVKEATQLLKEHGYPVLLKGKIYFDEDPLGRFENERQLGYTISATKDVYVRSYGNLNSLEEDCFYNTENVYGYYDFSRSIITHELIHAFLFYHNVRGIAIHEFAAYYFGLASMNQSLLHRVLEANKDEVPFDGMKSAACPLWALVDYYPAVKSYLYWERLSPKNRTILFKRIVSREFIQKHIGE